MKNVEWKIISKVLSLLILCLLTGWLFSKMMYTMMIIPGIGILYITHRFYLFNRKTYDEVAQYVETVHYRDFSRHFNIKEAPNEIKELREGFNEINDTIKGISSEKEASFQYLQKVLEIINTGIISYDLDSGEIVWYNETMKNFLQIPYLRTIHSLEKRNSILYKKIIDIKSNQQEIIKLSEGLKEMKVLLTATAFKMDTKIYKLVAIQNINEAIDETEANAWQKLLSVMTHEIMNSVAPIASLSDTLKKRLDQIMNASEEKEDIVLGIDTIQKRSEGLLKFAQVYRNLNKISQPQIKAIPIKELFANTFNLLNAGFEEQNIDLDILLKEPNLIIHADPNLLEQTVINLLVNAKDAVLGKKNGHVELSAQEENHKMIIKVSDNGKGIPPEIIDRIFIPFYSTKANGSGIGLSLSKQIMLMHKGNIHVASKEGVGTVFELSFPKMAAVKQ